MKKKGSPRERLAKLLTLLDDGDPRGIEALAGHRIARLPYIVGITGAAGVGKSMLLNRLLTTGRKGVAGVLAVDPTNPKSGGALLGDRVRMPRLPEGVFFRSVATRNGTGGLSEKLIDMAAAMKSSGYDEVWVETVGIGQDELAIRQVADTVIVVEAPGLGDEVQAMKASPLSIADVVVVNKSDLPGAAAAAAVIAETTGIKPILTSALDGAGLDELAGWLAALKKSALGRKTKESADRQKFSWRIRSALASKWAERFAHEPVELSGAPPEVYAKLLSLTAFMPDHVAIAVPDLDAAVRQYRHLGFFLERREKFPGEKVETAFFNAGGFHIELLQATSSDSPISKFVGERGGGLHHIAFAVPDARAAEKTLTGRGVQTLGRVRPGTRGKQILFLHPKSAARTLLEFCSREC